MAEEVKYTDPKAEVCRRQIEIAKSMKVKPEILKVLEKVEEWQNREWLYICALDGMPLEQIQNLQVKKASTGQIRKARMDYMREFLLQTDLFQKRLENLQKEVRDVCKESRDTRDAIERGLEDALKKQALAQEETIRAKNQMIEMLNRQSEELRQQVQELKKLSQGKTQYFDNHYDQIDRERFSQEAVAKKGEFYDETITSVIANPESPDNDKNEESEQNLQRDKGGIFGYFSSVRKDSDVRRFIERYIKNDSITPEQKEFLLDCLEEGLSVKEVEKFAAPGLSVDVMQRLKKLQMKS